MRNKLLFLQVTFPNLKLSTVTIIMPLPNRYYKKIIVTVTALQVMRYPYIFTSTLYFSFQIFDPDNRRQGFRKKTITYSISITV